MDASKSRLVNKVMIKKFQLFPLNFRRTIESHDRLHQRYRRFRATPTSRNSTEVGEACQPSNVEIRRSVLRDSPS